MPEVLKFEDIPVFFSEFQIEPFHQEFIPGSRVLCREISDGTDVYFQIPTPVAQKMTQEKLEDLKKQVHGWWQIKET
jgi:hypothetical protein